jgi:hypothetical protein
LHGGIDNSSVPQIIADTATGFFGLDSQSLDLGDIMDGTTDRITAPGAGVMELDFCVYFSTVTSAGYVQLRIYKNGSTTGIRPTRIKAPTTDNTYHMVKPGSPWWPAIITSLPSKTKPDPA